MKNIIEIKDLSKVYDKKFQALKPITLNIQTGEIFALLGPNGAGKTTLISLICSLTNPSTGTIKIAGHDLQKDYRKARNLIGLVPQELTTDMFVPVGSTVAFSRGLFGLPPNPDYIEEILKKLSLWDKVDQPIMALSGGMKRRVLIAKALAHEPKILFLDEPTAGVDVSLRKNMWKLVHSLRELGVTIILTTHYIEEAEEMADRIGIINKGELILTEKKSTLMKKMGKKKLTLKLKESLQTLPQSLEKYNLIRKEHSLIYEYNAKEEESNIHELFTTLANENIHYKDVETKANNLEEIFVELTK